MLRDDILLPMCSERDWAWKGWLNASRKEIRCSVKLLWRRCAVVEMFCAKGCMGGGGKAFDELKYCGYNVQWQVSIVNGWFIV